jgi:hypothetical protein
VRERYYGLLRVYLEALRELDLSEEQVREAPEGVERERVIRKLKSTKRRCSALRREILLYPDIGRR